MLLENAGLVVEARAPGVDERAVEAACAGQDPKISPEQLALRLAEAKAASVARTCPDRVVLGADQVLEADGCVFHKPASLEEARAQLGELAGRVGVDRRVVVADVALKGQRLPGRRGVAEPHRLGDIGVVVGVVRVGRPV